MTSTYLPVYNGVSPQQRKHETSSGEYVRIKNEVFYKISHYDSMEPFFMSLVSSSNHWMFISSTGGLSAGRVNADHALFPYYTVDKITENSEGTGAKTLLLVKREGKAFLWEPFSSRMAGIYSIERNLYKNISGSVLIFEEINSTLGLTFRYGWRTGDRFGFIKSNTIKNDSTDACTVEVLDGLQNLLAANISSQTQNVFSPLLDGYKRNELDVKTGLGIFTLNSSLTDLAEPSESLLATICWQVGLNPSATLLTSQQLDSFRCGMGVVTETETRGQRGAYFVKTEFELKAGEQREWHLAADVDQDAADVVNFENLLLDKKVNLISELEDDMASNQAVLDRIVASSDGLQLTEHTLLTSHHYANVMFNEMRGGYFPAQYQVEKSDFINYVDCLNHGLVNQQADFFSRLPKAINLKELRRRAADSGCPDLLRFANAYLPLSFSRRHGDPSRPWNQFSINIKKKDGSQQLDYEGNWRDIFQNWEALAYSYPEYTENMISTFLNATTADGYNPYRVTRRGIDWEIPEPNNPWANIGYWSDHQIIYLLKLMELSKKIHPGCLEEELSKPLYSYTRVPYHIKPYTEILKDPFNTIAFDWNLEKKIKEQFKQLGGDGKLLVNDHNEVVYATLTEKLLTLLLAKMVNFVPEGGIWMNTQRPEWNDANNALVGKGLSVVTLAYLRRFVVFMIELFQQAAFETTEVHAEINAFFVKMADELKEAASILPSGFTDKTRRDLMDALGQVGSDYRENIYQNGFTGKLIPLNRSEIIGFLSTTLQFVDHSLRANKRADALYHSYNTLALGEKTALVNPLYEMLEGQVAILSSGLLGGTESLELLEALRSSQLFREDQHSYILYPDRILKGFVERNLITSARLEGLQLVSELVKAEDKTLLLRDSKGDYHFSGSIRNINGVKNALEKLGAQDEFKKYVKQDAQKIEEIFEETFKHEQFTGRSGTFFAYEGLGSIYWHMVSKLLLAVQETIQRTQTEPSTLKLIECYRDIRAGQCFNKTPSQYGAFPTDPYSHTPAKQGAKQPGMSGMVKEEILARQAELGFLVKEGSIVFDFLFLDRKEMIHSPGSFEYLDVADHWQKIDLAAGSLAYSVCQVPVILQLSKKPTIQVHLSSGFVQKIEGLRLDSENSRHIFERDGVVHHLIVSVPE